MTGSLRVRLLWWLLVPLALYVFVTGYAEHDNARSTANLVEDNALLSSARMIAGEVDWVDGTLRADVPPAAALKTMRRRLETRPGLRAEPCVIPAFYSRAAKRIAGTA